MTPLTFIYHFSFPDGKKASFTVEIDPENLSLIAPPDEKSPEWTRLGFHQCPSCPLTKDLDRPCPVAKNLHPVIDRFRDSLSYEQVTMEIHSENRSYRKETDLQHALSSLFGLYMATSGCPVLDKLRPLVRTHLPFASLEETTYRAVSMYLTAQYLLVRKGKTPDWDLSGLVRIYEDVKTVNLALRKRISTVMKEDAGLNAICHLGCYAQFTNRLIEEGLAKMEKYFSSYFEAAE